ncbi:phosphoserine phosphatase-like isoform X2 [Pongo abelii]|uniref:phosphoserine phosphatase-like isoform X2 n=1 Tax=Pongo abelii TaxID=9601 RepID=UPI0023E7E7F6|nr:phosphoserine phosphatase-like isoform X2 [Pongo abelii]
MASGSCSPCLAMASPDPGLLLLQNPLVFLEEMCSQNFGLHFYLGTEQKRRVWSPRNLALEKLELCYSKHCFSANRPADFKTFTASLPGTRRAMGGTVSFKAALMERLALIQPSREQVQRLIAEHLPHLTPGITRKIIPRMVSRSELRKLFYSADAVCFDVDSTVVREGIDELAKVCDVEDAVLEMTHVQRA